MIEFYIVLRDASICMKRVIFDQFKGFSTSVERELEYFLAYGRQYIQELAKRYHLSLLGKEYVNDSRVYRSG